jgi:aryl-alcohol dehydrogenase-like predicted oxidoreductase
MNFGIRTDEKESIQMIDYALDQGINIIDTANVYGTTRNGDEGIGRSEEIIGKAFAQNGKRDRVILATKVFGRVKQSDPNGGGLSRRHITHEVENSLRRLQTDHIDIYQLHRPMSNIPIDETLRAVDDLIQAGKVRYLGTSFFAPWQIVESLWASRENHLSRVISEQSPYSMVARDIERHLVPMAQKYEIALLTISPLEGGLLTGKYHRDEDFPKHSRFTTPSWNGFYSSGLTGDVWDFVDFLRDFARKKGCTASQLALAWVAQQPGISSVIIGPRTLEQLEDNLGSLDVVFSEGDRRKINELSPPGGSLLNR